MQTNMPFSFMLSLLAPRLLFDNATDLSLINSLRWACKLLRVAMPTSPAIEDIPIPKNYST